MSLLHHALRAGQAPVVRPATASGRIAVLAGAGGVLGSAVLEHALASGGFSHVRALVTSPVTPAMRGFESQTLEQLAERRDPHVDTGFIVFDRERHANGREAAFLRPDPAELLALARRLQESGVRRLLVVLPHAPALLPHALKLGLANLDEQAISALDFEHVVFVRSAQSATGAARPGAGRLERLGRAMLGQLHWMIPQQDQPVRAAKVAAFVARLALHLPAAAPGTRVVPPELVWQAGQGVDVDALAATWLSRRTAA
jgi:hypothetical protein